MRKNELELDHHFWNAISSNATLQTWFLAKSKFRSLDLRLITDEKWHQRWYRNPVTKKDSETDILLMFFEPISSNRYAIHIENKPDHRKWEPNQARNYRDRASDRMKKWNYVDFETALLAPHSFVARHPLEIALFDFLVTYEEISTFIPQFVVSD